MNITYYKYVLILNQIRKNHDMNTLELKTRLSANIKQLRKEKKWSQFELAEQADISEQTINSIESRRLWPSDETLAKITDALDTDISRLFLPDCSTEFPGRELPEDLCTAVVQSVRNLVEATLQQYTK